QPTRVGIERDHRVRVQVVARASVAGPRAGIAGAPVRDVELGIVRAREPRGRAASAPRVAGPRLVTGLAGPRNRVRLPRLFAGLGGVGHDEAADAALAAGHADANLAAYRTGGRRRPAPPWTGWLRRPARRAA